MSRRASATDPHALTFAALRRRPRQLKRPPTRRPLGRPHTPFSQAQPRSSPRFLPPAPVDLHSDHSGQTRQDQIKAQKKPLTYYLAKCRVASSTKRLGSDPAGRNIPMGPSTSPATAQRHTSGTRRRMKNLFSQWQAGSRWHHRHVTTAPQECSEPECSSAAAFKTRTKPAWCDQHITEILRRGGLEPLEPFVKPTGWRLTRCHRCGCVAHYQFEYTLDKNRLDEATCRACYWREWATSARALVSSYARLTPVPESIARQRGKNHGYDYLGSLTDPSLPDDPHRVRCVYCGRISAERMGDIDFGCACQSNPRRARQTANVSGPKKADLLKDSAKPVLDWWDHDRNDLSVWETASVRARRDAHWRCPDCGVRFIRKISDMVAFNACPDCEPKRRIAQYARYRTTPITEVPELLAAWADEADPATVTVAGGGLRRFQCPQGHHPKVLPLTFLSRGATCAEAA